MRHAAWQTLHIGGQMMLNEQSGRMFKKKKRDKEEEAPENCSVLVHQPEAGGITSLFKLRIIFSHPNVTFASSYLSSAPGFNKAPTRLSKTSIFLCIFVRRPMLSRSPETNVLVFIKRDRKRRRGQFSEAPGRNEVVWMLQTSVQDTSRLSRPPDTMATLMCGSLHLVAYGAPRTHLSKPFRRDGESWRDKGQIQSRCPKLNGCLQVREYICNMWRASQSPCWADILIQTWKKYIF